MLRKRAVAVALTALLSPMTFGLGLGTLKTNSALNEPFDANIEIVGAAVQDFDSLSAKLADARQFQRAGVARDAVLLNLRFEVVSSEAGADYVRITTKDPVREPFLNFLLEIDWANGKLVREYTVLLDPPLYDRNRVKPLASAPTRAPQPAPRPMAAPTSMPLPAPAPASTPAPAAAPVAPSDGSLGVAGANDTAWGLALAHRPDSSVSVQQMMLALLRANPDAFVNDNVNLLRRGAVLRMPAQAEMAQLSQREAVAEVQRQHELWQEYRQGATSTTSPAPVADTEPEDADDATAPSAETPAIPPADDARLELAAPEEGEATKTPGGEAGGSLDDSLAKEDLESKAQENSELAAKLEEADQIIDLLQRQVQIKDEELAALQKRLGDTGVEVPAATTLPAEPATTTVETPTPPAAPAAEPATPSAPVPVAEAPTPVPPPAAPEPTPAPVAAAGPLDALVPEHLRAAVPGGAYTILGIAASLLLLLVVGISKALGGRRDKAIVATRPTAHAAAVAATSAAATAESLVSTRDDLTAFDATAPAPDQEQFQRTMEATAEALVAAPEDEDPLEEVNVYLAYERFDQAEELVRKVIAKYPFEHKYKLRLLEIYYSANDKRAYEDAARELLNAVGDTSPLWASALAMWGEMSPERALFAAGAEPAPVPVQDATSAFVDITSENTAGGATMSMPPGGDDLLASTQVGLTNDFSGTSTLDFDLGESFTGDAPSGQLLDVTAGEAQNDVIDLAATAASAGLGDVLDLTAGADGQTPAADAVFDISGEDLLDLGDTAENPQTAAVDRSAAREREYEKTAFDVTSPSPGTPDRAEAATVNAVADEDSQDFDISDTVAPALQRLSEISARPGLQPEVDDDLILDFDIEGLSEPVPAPLAGATTSSANDDFDLTIDSDLDAPLGGVAELEIDGDLSIQDAAGLDFDIGAPADSETSPESEVEFDLALQDTTDFESLSIDDTLELPKSSASRSMRPVDAASESLEDLTRSMEASIAGLDLDDEKDSILDLALEPGTDSIDLDFGLEDIGELNELDTLALDPDELRKAADAVVDRTLAMPRDNDTEYSSAMDETDTKLNLAKAYIELGDGEGARTILDEVVADGTPAQQDEARKLLSQLA